MMVLNISAYQFVTLPQDQLAPWRQMLLEQAVKRHIKGSILLSTEGINLFLAGQEARIQELISLCEQTLNLSPLWCKQSWSEKQPFSRMLVKIKKEIIPMAINSVQPSVTTAPYIDPNTLKSWYTSGKNMVLLDTRNDFEVALGHFDQAIHLSLKDFRAFDQALDTLDPQLKHQPVVTYCTGGIRCEKAALRMLEKGFTEVYQLKGGILNYFEQCGGAYYHGECFVFDKRVALDAQLNETLTQQCFECRRPLTVAEQKLPECPYCL